VESETSEVGISLGSYLPWSAVYPGWAARQAKAAGYQFLQVLPFRGLWHRISVINYRALSILPVRYLEDAWGRPPSLCGISLSPFFPSQKRTDLLFEGIRGTYVGGDGRRPQVIGHDFKDPQTLVEVHPGLWMTVDEILEEAEQRGQRSPLVPDLWHLRHDAIGEWLAIRPTNVTVGTLLPNWQVSLPRLLPKSGVIHLSPRRDRDEFGDCLAHRPTELGEMLACVREAGWRGHFVVEATRFPPRRSLNALSLVGELREFRHWVLEQLA
jgi:hypothetical protein